MINTDDLRRECEAFNLEINNEAAERFDNYARLLVEWNEKINLTAITEPSQIVTRHFADSLSFFKAAAPKNGASLIDVGSGAGFPGLPIKILRPDLQVTLLDATNKRIGFLNAVSAELGLDVQSVHARAEEAAAKPNFREQFDFATARAVAELRILVEYCLGFVAVGGSFVALKGRLSPNETAAAQNALAAMGGKIGGTQQITLSDLSERTLLSVKKISHTPTQYPRCTAKISKKPL